MEESKKTVLCIAAKPMGHPFMVEAKSMGWRVIVLTTPDFLEGAWPEEIVDSVYAAENLLDELEVRNAISYLCRQQKIDKIIPMADFEVSVASRLREHLRVPGMGETTARYFRDKLAMRMKAAEDGIDVPEFVHILHYPDIHDFTRRISPPWLLKQRSSSAPMVIETIHSEEELWQRIDSLGDRQSDYVLEQYIPGTVYHVESIVSERQIAFAIVGSYGVPLLNLKRSGGVFTSRMVEYGVRDDKALKTLNKEMISILGLLRGVTHIEFIKHERNHKFYFLDAGARVVGSYIPEMIEHATGINLWREWAKIELADFYRDYKLPPVREEYGSLAMCLAKEEYPNHDYFDAPEVAWKQIEKPYHAGFILTSPSFERISELLDTYLPELEKSMMAHVQEEENIDC